MGHCKNCKWWDQEKDKDWCDIKQEYELGRGMCLKAVESWSEKSSESLMVTLDGSQYMALLFTKGDFGCVLFEEKD